MKIIVVPLAVLLLPLLAAAHHSVAAFYDRNTTVEVEGAITEKFWRNPHVGLKIVVVNDVGETEEWELEAGTTNTLARRGVTAESLNIGDRIRVAGAASRRGEPAIFISNVLMPSGEEFVASDREASLRWTSGSSDAAALPVTVAAADEGLFRVWGFRESFALRSPLALTPSALAAVETFDPRTDDPSLECIPPGMPNAITNPYPMEFIDEGNRIIQRIEEWDARRVIHMTEEARARTEAPSHLGYSVGFWEGSTLIVGTNQIAFPFLDADGTPMSENVTMVERYTLSEGATRLEHEIVVTDPDNLAEPAIWDTTWVYRPGVEVRQFECTLPETPISVYR